jgi:hypothetical protein
MSHFDDFFRASYLGMCRYCASFGHDWRDVEEVVADVIHKRYDEYLSKITAPTPGTTMRQWMNRRALLDLGSRRAKHARQKTTATDDVGEHGLVLDTPESVLELKQALPEVHPILIEYEASGKTEGGNGKRGRPKGANSSADKTRFCRERKKFMEALRA